MPMNNLACRPRTVSYIKYVKQKHLKGQLGTDREESFDFVTLVRAKLLFGRVAQGHSSNIAYGRC